MGSPRIIHSRGRELRGLFRLPCRRTRFDPETAIADPRKSLMSDSNPKESEDPGHSREIRETDARGEPEDGYALEPEPEAAEPSTESDTPSVPDDPAEGDRRCERCGAPLPEDRTRTACPSCGFDVATGLVVDPESATADAADEPLESDEVDVTMT